MKTVEFFNPNKRIERLPDELAHKIVRPGVSRYVPKSYWKKHVRDVADLKQNSVQGG